MIEPTQLEALLSKSFPGVKLGVTPGIGSVLYAFEVWDFKVSFSLTVGQYSKRDRIGEAFATCKLQNDKYPPMVFKTMTLMNISEVQDFLGWFHSVLAGIQAAITLAYKAEAHPDSPLYSSGKDSEC